MSMYPLINQFKMHAEAAAAQVQTCIWGIIDSYDPNTHAVKVRRQPEDPDNPAASLSNWMPLPTMAVGAGFGMQAAPNIGDMVVVGHIYGEANEQIVLGYFFNDAESPPGAKAGEFYYIHQSGSFIKFTNEGKVSLNGNVEIDLTAPAINITVTGDANVNAANINLAASSALSMTSPSISMGAGGQAIGGLTIFDELKAYIDNHKHSDPQGGETDVPTTQLPLSAKTTTIQGG